MIGAARPHDIRWAAERVGMVFHPPYSGIAFERDDECRAVAIFQNYTGSDVEITIAAVELPRRFLRAIRRYVVEQLHCRRATFKTKPTNSCAVKAMSRLNAICEGRQHKFYADGSDALIFAIHDEDFSHG
jgi:hypothetical protein